MRDDLVTECLCHGSADKIRMPAARQRGLGQISAECPRARHSLSHFRRSGLALTWRKFTKRAAGALSPRPTCPDAPT